MEFIKKNRLLVAAVIVEVLLLIFTAWDFFLPRFYLNMEGADIPFNGGWYEDGCHVDEATGNAGYFTYGPNITLPRGVFSITIHYSTSTNQNTVSCMGGNTTLHTLKYDSITLSPASQSVTFTLWSAKEVSDFQIATIYGGSGSLTIRSIEIAETYAGSTMMAFYVILFGMLVNLAILAVSYYRTHTVSNETIGIILVLGGLIAFSSYPLFTDYLTEGHDLLFHLLRIEGIKDGLLGGQFPVKIQPTQLSGYGYAASVFYGDLFLYIPAILRIVGFSVQDAYMYFVILVNAATVLICYFSLRDIFKNNRLGLLGTVLYSIAPYRLINIYGRAAVGEYTAMIFLPLLACGLYRIFTADTKSPSFKKGWILPVIAYTGIIESHILSCEMVGIFTILICLLLIKRVFVKERFIVLVKVVVFTVLVNLGFMIPLADYMLRKVCIISEGAMTTSNIQQNGLYPARLFSIFLNGDSMPYSRKANYELGMQGEMGISIGIALIIVLLVFLFFMLIQNKKITAHYRLGKFAWLLGAITLVMSLDCFPWDFLNDIFGDLVGNIQFPWRFLGIGSLALSIAGCCALEFIHENFDISLKVCYAAVVASATILVSGFMLGDLLDNEEPYRVYSANALRTQTSGTYFNEYAPVDTDFEALNGQTVLSSDALTLTSYQKHYTTIKAAISNSSGTEQYIELPLLYYPGYSAESDGTALICDNGENNLVRITIPAGFEGNFEVCFKQPVLWIAGEWVSIITCAYIGLRLFKKKC